MDKIVFTMGDKLEGEDCFPIEVTVPVKKTWYIRFKYWMFFKFFPFAFKEWK